MMCLEFKKKSLAQILTLLFCYIVEVCREDHATMSTLLLPTLLESTNKMHFILVLVKNQKQNVLINCFE